MHLIVRKHSNSSDFRVVGISKAGTLRRKKSRSNVDSKPHTHVYVLGMLLDFSSRVTFYLDLSLVS